MRFRAAPLRRVDWPALAWAARIGRDGSVAAVAGAAVEETEDGLSAAAFRAWLARHGGLPPRRTAWPNRAAAPLARLFWTGALPRALHRAGIPWPRAPQALWDLRVAARDGSLIFQ